ncbi:MAG: polysaccharide pyruvyl transferase family protein [Prevotella sp.]|nr:polysaccharide pyruvyl transferase family protein [Prevotellaceae bacterium]MDY3935564.1 polysaccharide pyruvyl transferase family protein [Prevotella sp.]
MRKIILEIYYTFIYYIPNFIRELILCIQRKPIVYLLTFLDFRKGKFHNGNWGDDLNYYFIGRFTNKRIVPFQYSLIARWFNKQNYMCIGSMIHDVNSNTIVWGSGVIADDAKYEIKEKPKKVVGVRGKLTREYLLKRGIKCPEVYGDPALLLPLIYQKEIKKTKYKLGIIPHIYDENNEFIQKASIDSDILVISMKKYDDWHEVIDQICSCEMIISSSLHGVIISDAYNIPNSWVEFSDKVIGKGFKFRDYFSSVGKVINEPIFISQDIEIEYFKEKNKNWCPPQINLQPLIEACPFENLKIILKKNL